MMLPPEFALLTITLFRRKLYITTIVSRKMANNGGRELI